MPHNSLRITSGVNQNQTPALNETGISQSQLIRFMTDGAGGLTIQKMGGWTKYYTTALPSIIRALWGWEDTNANTHLAAGGQNIPGSYRARLNIISGGVLLDNTPTSLQDNITPVVSTTSGDNSVIITDSVIVDITQFDSVYIPVHISIGGIVLFGLYQCDPDGFTDPTRYTVLSTDILGNSKPATSSSTTAVVPVIDTTINQTVAVVTLPNHGYLAGDTYPVLVPTTVGGVVFFGNYIVNSVNSANDFNIIAQNVASATDTKSINHGNARFLYSFGVGAVPTSTGYGVGGYGIGGYGVGPSIIPTTGISIPAVDWSLDNWGDVLLSCPITPTIILATTGASGTGTTATVTFAEDSIIAVGTDVIIANMVPSGYNGTWTVTASGAGTISFASTATGAQTSSGTVTVQNVAFQPIYGWNALSGSPISSILPFAPPVNDGMFVAMPQRQIVAWGSTFDGVQDPLLVRWCDVNDYGSWIALPTNQAGSYRIPKGSKIVAGIQAPQQGLLWTDIGLWSMQYQGPPYVYSFNELGSGCGLIARKAAGTLAGVVYWMGPSQFYTLGSEGVQPLMCPVWDIIFQNLNQAQTSRIRIAVNSRFSEVMWFYPSSGSNEVDSYVKFNAQLQVWDYGLLARSAWIDQSVLGPPIGSDPNTLYVYQHETTTDADGQPLIANFTTGYFAMADGDQKVFVDQVWPDFKYGYYNNLQTANMQITFNTVDYPNDPPQTFGPYTVTGTSEYFMTRMRGRLTSITVGSADVNSFWRTGNLRYRAAIDGKY